MAEKYPTFGRFVDWGATIAGFVVAFVILVLLSLIAAMAGVIGNAVVVGIISFVSLLCGGWVAGYLAPYNGTLHGVMVAVVTIFALVLLMVVGASMVTTLFGLPLGMTTTTAAAAALFVGFIIQLIGGAIGGYLGELSTSRPEARA